MNEDYVLMWLVIMCSVVVSGLASLIIGMCIILYSLGYKCRCWSTNTSKTYIIA